MSLTLYAPHGNPRAAKIEVVIEHLKIDVAYNRIDYSQIKSPEFLAKHPLGKVPLLETPEGPIYESNAILRYLARKHNALYGSNAFEAAQVDQWLDFLNSDIDNQTITAILMLAQWVPPNKDTFNEAKKHLKDVAKVLESALKGKKYLVGNDITIADITLAGLLFYPFKLFWDEKYRQSIPSVTEWFKTVSSLPAFVTVKGKAWLCEKEFEPVFPEEDHKEHKEHKEHKDHKEHKEQKKQQKGEKKEEKKKDEKKKEETKKEAKKEGKKEDKKKKKESDDEEEEEDPFAAAEKKKVNPLDLLPPTPFKLDDFKRDISNAADRSTVLADFWTKYDPQGWSLWKVTYQKYTGEGQVDYLTANLMNGFIRNLDHFRKYAFAGYGVYGVPGNYDIKSVYLWRGTEIPLEWKDHQSYEYHNFEKLDHTNPAHKQLVEQYWIKTNEGDMVEGQPVYLAKHFK